MADGGGIGFRPASRMSELGFARLQLFIHDEWMDLNKLGPEQGPLNKRMLRLQVQMLQWKEMDYFDGAELRVICD